MDFVFKMMDFAFKNDEFGMNNDAESLSEMTREREFRLNIANIESIRPLFQCCFLLKKAAISIEIRKNACTHVGHPGFVRDARPAGLACWRNTQTRCYLTQNTSVLIQYSSFLMQSSSF